MDLPDLDLKEMLDRSVPDGPAHRPVEDRLTAGRALVRRRRIGAGVAALATLAVLGVGAVALTGGGDGAGAVRDPGFAGSTTSTTPNTQPSDASAPATGPASPADSGGPNTGGDHSLAPDGQLDPVIAREDSPVRYDGDRLVAKAGSTIVATVTDPQVSNAGVPAGATATAVRVHDAQGSWFVLGWTTPGGQWDLITEPVGLRADTLQRWLGAVATAQDGGAGVR